MRRILKYSLRTLLVLFVGLNIIMACHAYKFTHFYDPGEVQVKAAADKNFWDHSKELLFGFTFVKEKDTPAPPGYNTIYLHTKNGLRLEGWHCKISGAKGTVALFHGHGGNKNKITEEANEFLKLGYSVFLLDFRAHGNSEGNTCTIGVEEGEDVKLAYDYIRNDGEKNIILWGISLGAASITRCINEYDCHPNKIILELPFGSLQQAVKARLKMMGVPQQPFAAMLTFWGGLENGFWAFNHKPSEYVKKITCPVLLQFAKNDVRVTQNEMEDIYNNISAEKTLEIYSNSAHESLCKKERAKWIASVSAFLSR